MRACDHQIMMPGPIGEIQAKSTMFSHPFAGTPVMIPLDKVAVPIAKPETRGANDLGDFSRNLTGGMGG